MFRVVREFVEVPKFLLVCDNVNCMASATGDANIESPKVMMETQTTFIDRAVKEGWIIGLAGQICPGHAALLAKRVEEGKQLVKAPDPYEAVKFGKAANPSIHRVER